MRDERKRQFLFCAGLVGLVVLTVVAYAPALDCGFVWDDDNHVTRLEVLSKPDGLRDIWFGVRENLTPQYYPLTFSAFWLQRRLWGLNPLGYHAVNIALQLANALLLWRLLSGLRLRGAWLAAALFAVHPTQVMSVVWTTELKNLLCGLFMLVSARLFLPPAEGGFARPSGSRWRMALSLAAYLLALLSKTPAGILVLYLVGFLWWRRMPAGRTLCAGLVAMAILGAVAGSITVWVEQVPVWGEGPRLVLGLGERAVLSVQSFWHYVRQLFWPVGLQFLHTQWEILGLSGVAAVVAFAAVLCFLWTRRTTWRRGALLAVLLFYLAGPGVLLLHVLYMMRYTWVADHWTYFGSPAAMTLLAAGSIAVCDRLRIRRLPRAASAGVLLALLLVLTRGHAGIFKNEETLWRHTLRGAPDAWLALNNLGIQMAQRGYAAEAESLFARALTARQEYAEPYVNLGLIHASRGDEAEAERWFRRALDLDPAAPQANYNLGLALARTGRLEESLAHYREVIRARPDAPDAYVNMGNALARLGRLSEARAAYESAIRLDPAARDARVNLDRVNDRLRESLERTPPP